MKANQRRDKIHHRLLEAQDPITANQLAKEFQVSRQVIVGDIALLRARNIEIKASNEGYEIPKGNHLIDQTRFRGKIACQHGSDQTRIELETILKYGGFLEDVEIDHPVFGMMKAPLVIKSSADIDRFIQSLEEYRAQMLSTITDGVHLHTLSCPDSDSFQEIKAELAQIGILLNEND